MSEISLGHRDPNSRFEFSVRSIDVVGVTHDEEFDLYLVVSRNNVVFLL